MKKILLVAGLVIAFSFVAGPILAKADTVADIQAEIAQLMAQIAVLQQQMTAAQQGQSSTATTTPVAPVFCHNFNTGFGIVNYASYSSSDPINAQSDLTALENILTSGGFAPAATFSTSTFDKTVAQGVMAFQKNYGLAQSGWVSIAMRAKLNSLYGCGTNPPQPVSRTPNWTCGWGQCVNGYQSEGAVDSNSCGLPSSGVTIACPALARACVPSNSSITINSVSGPNSLNVGQTGTWQVNATAPSGSNLTYSVDWGDAYYPLARLAIC